MKKVMVIMLGSIACSAQAGFLETLIDAYTTAVTSDSSISHNEKQIVIQKKSDTQQKALDKPGSNSE